MILHFPVHMLFFLCIVCVSPVVVVSGLEENNCEKYNSSGFSYGHFFKTSDLKSNHNGGVLLNFRVRTPSDAHIKFSEKPFPSEQEPAYEVVIGAGNNTFSFIRRKVVDLSKIRIDTEDYLSSEETRGFWIWISQFGEIEVGKEGEMLPFMSWEDDDPLDIQYISFSSWNNVYGEWFFNCDNIKAVSGKNEKKSKYLIHHLLLTNDNEIGIQPPIDPDISNVTNIYAHFSCSHIYMDERRSNLVLDGVLSLLWEDRRNMWSPEEFGNLQYIDLTSYFTWTPEISLRNAADDFKRYHAKVRVFSNGTLFWKYSVHFSVFCKGINYSNWPKDKHMCQIELELTPPHSSLQLIPMKGGVDIHQSRIHTGWSIEQVNVKTKKITSPENTLKNFDGFTYPEPDHILFEFTLIRSENIYYNALIIILAMISTLTLLSFWTSPMGSMKVGLQCISLVITTLALMFCWKMIPVHSSGDLPTIFSAFIMIMNMVWISIVSTVITSNFIFLAPSSIPSSISTFLRSKFLAMFFCLPQPSNKIVAAYNRHCDGSVLNKEDAHGYSFKSKECELQWHWILISIVTERIILCTYAAVFMYLFSTLI